MAQWNIVVAGCGQMANTWIEYVKTRHDAAIVGLVDVQAEASVSMADRHGLSCGLYSDLKEAIRRSGANLVFDITTPNAHHSTSGTALEMGCHVMAEKPLAAHMSEAVQLTKIARQAQRSLAIMQNRRYLRSIRAYRELIRTGAIGSVGFIGADFFLAPRFGGFREEMASPLVLDMSIHTFDQARFITGADPISVTCQEWNPPGSWYRGSASAICTFEMNDGSMFNYRGSWCAQGFPTSWEASWRVVGSQGTAIWDGDRIEAESYDKDGQASRTQGTTGWNGQEGHFGCLDEMFLALKEGRPAETNAEDNLKSIAMVFGAIESAKLGKPIHIPTLLAQGLSS